MIDSAIATALIAALSALGGAALAHWGAARLQAQHHQAEFSRERTAHARAQRAELLGWVLEARVRRESLLPRLEGRKVSPVSADKTAAAAARQAYAVALLYLADARPLMRAFYRSTVQLQLALDKPSEEALAHVSVAVSSWQADYEALEQLIASLDDLA